MTAFDAELYGAFVRVLRRKAGMTAAEMSGATGVPEPDLLAIETGAAEPVMTQFMSINELLFDGPYSPRAFALGAGDMEFMAKGAEHG